MPLDKAAWRDYGAELERQAKGEKEAPGKAEEAGKEEGESFFFGTAERQAAQGSDLSGEIAAEEKDYTDEDVEKEASALRYLAAKTAENVGEKVKDTLTGGYHALLEDEYRAAGMEEEALSVAEEEAARQEGK